MGPTSTAGDGAEDEEGLAGVEDCGGQRCVARFEGKILLAGEEAQEGTTLAGVVSDGAGEGRVCLFESIEEHADGWMWGGQVKHDLAGLRGKICEDTEVMRKLDADRGHCSISGPFGEIRQSTKDKEGCAEDSEEPGKNSSVHRKHLGTRCAVLLFANLCCPSVVTTGEGHGKCQKQSTDKELNDVMGHL